MFRMSPPLHPMGFLSVVTHQRRERALCRATTHFPTKSEDRIFPENIELQLRSDSGR